MFLASLIKHRICLRLIVNAIYRLFCVSNAGAYSAFEAEIIGKKLAATTRDLMHLLGCGYTISRRRPETPEYKND